MFRLCTKIQFFETYLFLQCKTQLFWSNTQLLIYRKIILIKQHFTVLIQGSSSQSLDKWSQSMRMLMVDLMRHTVHDLLQSHIVFCLVFSPHHYIVHDGFTSINVFDHRRHHLLKYFACRDTAKWNTKEAITSKWSVERAQLGAFFVKFQLPVTWSCIKFLKHLCSRHALYDFFNRLHGKMFSLDCFVTSFGSTQRLSFLGVSTVTMLFT